jgi:DNA polymerase III subunit delta
LILKGAQLERFLSKPDPSVRAALIYGPDYGLVQERATTLAAAVGDPADPFAFVVFKPETIQSDPARLGDEAAALTFSGRRRVIRIRDAGDALTRAFAPWLEDGIGEAFVIVQAAELSKRSSLRALFENSRRAAAVACYPAGGAETSRLVEQLLGDAGLTAEPDALAFIAESVGADHGVTRRELEKLVTYMEAPGPGRAQEGGKARRVCLEDALACIGNSAATSLDALAEAACLGDLGALDRIVHRLLTEDGQQPVTILRTLARQLQRLLLAAGLAAAGRSPDQVMAQLRPPIFQRNRESFRRQMALWPAERLGAAIAILTEAELDCKTTGIPEQAVCERALLKVAHAAAASARR